MLPYVFLRCIFCHFVLFVAFLFLFRVLFACLGVVVFWCFFGGGRMGGGVGVCEVVEAVLGTRYLSEKHSVKT